MLVIKKRVYLISYREPANLLREKSPHRARHLRAFLLILLPGLKQFC